ncbi:MAG TPA: uracil-DNA glycosylase family protein [Tepidisphaeraceae bacterium]|nr:uracil-DNA glycosylase family protein [Tepidisphaeraceae bacterium]
MTPDEKRGRARLWLRSERAFGLNSLPAAQAIIPPPDDEEESAPAAATPSISRPAVATSVLFESPAPAASLPLHAGSFDSPPLSSQEKEQKLSAMNATEVSVCVKCRLCEARTHTVFGEGDPDAQIFFIGEGPGENEDLQGRPFVGRAGQLLDKMIAAMGLERKQVFIANIVKCRPPGNRVPAPDEVATCTPYLVRQIEIIRPKVIVTLGLPAAKYMLGTSQTMGRLRGQWQQWRGTKLMPTFHPAYLLRSYTEENRKMVWSDLKAVMKELGLPSR